MNDGLLSFVCGAIVGIALLVGGQFAVEYTLNGRCQTKSGDRYGKYIDGGCFYRSQGNWIIVK